MTTFTLTDIGFFDQLVAMIWRRKATPSSMPELDEPHSDVPARREFVQDMVSRNPDAFSSDLDVQNMMLFFPDRF